MTLKHVLIALAIITVLVTSTLYLHSLGNEWIRSSTKTYTVSFDKLDKLVVDEPDKEIIVRGELYSCMIVNTTIDLSDDKKIYIHKNVELIDPENNIWKAVGEPAILCTEKYDKIEGHGYVSVYAKGNVSIELRPWMEIYVALVLALLTALGVLLISLMLFCSAEPKYRIIPEFLAVVAGIVTYYIILYKQLVQH